MRQQIQTAGEIAADQTEPDGTLMLDDSTEASNDASEAGPAPDTSLPSGAGSGDGGSGSKWSLLGMLALILASVIAVVGSWWWWEAAHDDQLAAAQDRDAALIAGTEGVETINTLDYRDPDADLAAWEDVTTGQFQDGIASITDSQRQLLVDEKKIATAEVVDAAVLSMDGDEATVVTAVEITVVDDAAPDSEPTLKRNRFSAQMKLVEGEWKINNLQQVAVSLS